MSSKCQGNQLLCYPVDRDLSIGSCSPPFEQLATNRQTCFFGVILPQLKNLLILLSQTELTKSQLWLIDMTIHDYAPQVEVTTLYQRNAV